jgi:hypothetical protein
VHLQKFSWLSYLWDGERVEDGEHVGDQVVPDPGGLLVLRRLVGEPVPAVLEIVHPVE